VAMKHLVTAAGERRAISIEGIQCHMLGSFEGDWFLWG